MSSLILADGFSGNTVNANGSDTNHSGGGIVQFFVTQVPVPHFKLNYYLEALLFVSLSSLLVCVR